MYKIFKKQRRRRYPNNFLLYLFGSITTHLLFFAGLENFQLPQPIETTKNTPITIVEQLSSDNAVRSPKNAVTQPKPSSKPQTPPPKPPPEVKNPATTSPATKAPAMKQIPTPIPKSATPPPKVITPTPPKPDLPVLTSPESKITTQPQVKPKIKTPIKEKKIQPESSTTNTKPTLHRDPQKLPLDNITQPLAAKNKNNNITVDENQEQRDAIAEPEALTPQQLPSITKGNNQGSIPTKDSFGDRQSDKEEADENKTATNNNLPTPQQPLSISCEANCLPEYPDTLDGVEGTAGIKLTINRQGKVIDAAITFPHENSELNQSALSAAKEMEFSQIDRDRATVQINITFANE